MVKALEKMVLSSSGWRGVFASCSDEESAQESISGECRMIAAAGASVFAAYLRQKGIAAPCVITGMDARPTGPAIVRTVIRALLAEGCRVRFTGVVAAPEIMAFARQQADSADGFIYISASHNPIGHNGMKFGLTDGGVLPGEEAEKLTQALGAFFERPSIDAGGEKLLHGADDAAVEAVYARSGEEKERALAAYSRFSGLVWTGGQQAVEEEARRGLLAAPLGIVADLNGSARTASIDKAFFESLGILFKTINGETGNIAHRIVPEGEALLPCCRLLEEAHHENPAFVLGYVCDCDGDRGNLVIWDETVQAARPIPAQDVFALAVIAELAHSAWEHKGRLPGKTGVVVNDATSMRIEHIAYAFGARVFYAEVGEANVVGLARQMRDHGWTIRILGEGAAGGNITHPSAVRDPLATVMAIVKLLTVRGGAKGGLYKLWSRASAQEALRGPGFTPASLLKSLPAFVTTSSYEKEAILHIKTVSHALLKERYQRIFEREWECHKDELFAEYGIVAYEAQAFKGTTMFRSCKNFKDADRGGLRIIFFRDRRGSVGPQNAFAFIWMRGSGTEKAFRVMADVQGSDAQIERRFLAWQTKMVLEADSMPDGDDAGAP